MPYEPVWANGLPICSREECREYDGKRCRLLGFRPAYHCEPAMHVTLEKQRQLLSRCDEVLSMLEFDDGVPNVWPEPRVISAVRTRIQGALSTDRRRP